MKTVSEHPKWQHRIRANTLRIISGEVTVQWGRAYANFLREQADAVDAALGQPEHAQRREERGRAKARIYNTLRVLLEADPTLGAQQLATLTGAPYMTVKRYAENIRVRFNLRVEMIDLSQVPDARKRRVVRRGLDAIA